MKKSVFLISALLFLSVGAYAQDDDMYFTPSKTSKVNKTDKQPLKIQNGSYDEDDDAVYDADYSNGKKYSDAEIDAYNRRGYNVSKDTLFIGDGDKEANDNADRYADEYGSNDYYYSGRLARFHEPAVNIYFGYGVPYWGWSYGYYDWAWGYDPYWSWNYGWGWNWYPRYYGWYGGWGWSYPWHYHYGWNDWGWHRPSGGGRPWRNNSWNGGRYIAGQTDYHRVGSAGGTIWGGGRNYRSAIERNGTTTTYSANSRGFGTNRTNNTGRVNGNVTTRSFGSTRSYNSNNTSTRSVGGNVSTSSSSSRSFGSGSSSPSVSTRSFGGGGGGRSFGGGGGGGRSFGGGRR